MLASTPFVPWKLQQFLIRVGLFYIYGNFSKLLSQIFIFDYFQVHSLQNLETIDFVHKFLSCLVIIEGYFRHLTNVMGFWWKLLFTYCEGGSDSNINMECVDTTKLNVSLLSLLKQTFFFAYPVTLVLVC